VENRSVRFVVERDLTLCGHLNKDVGNLCGLPNFGNKSCILCPLCLLRLACCSCSRLFFLKFVVALVVILMNRLQLVVLFISTYSLARIQKLEQCRFS
jgi:hypothetical protein